MIRNMCFGDIEAVKEIDKLCFKADTKRTTTGIEGYIEASNNSSIVYEIDNKVVGYNFLHLWGSFAWFGPLGVHPEYKGSGIGKALIAHTIKILKEDYNASTIGLNTMPESSYNVGFYMNLGFSPLKLTLSLKKELDELDYSSDSNKYSVNEVNIASETDYYSLKTNLKNLANKVFKDFDLTPELNLIKHQGLGTIFELKDGGSICGIAICYTKSIRENTAKSLQIKLAIIDSSADYKLAIDSIVNACANYAKNIGYKKILIDSNTYNMEICNYLISKHHFKIYHTFVMLLMGKDNPFDSKGALLLTRLAG
ncbi:GNAT family N-acetyltransferase [Clostridium neuense]|uniref:GNAT family N-acetyltransferase n=1 Tax=Clostridium neuense TaxID=1728934 RepID=A0ABW8TKR0_9CLOT